jgi:hypothetical protein
MKNGLQHIHPLRNPYRYIALIFPDRIPRIQQIPSCTTAQMKTSLSLRVLFLHKQRHLWWLDKREDGFTKDLVQ